MSTTTTKGNGGIKRKFTSHDDFENVVFGEGEKCVPNRVIVLDDLMTETFNTKDNDTTMNLLMTKLSHHNNFSVLIICHELYLKGKNSILFREQLTSIHLHSIANQQKVKRYVYGFLADKEERRHFDELFNEHVLRVNNNLKGNK